MTVRFRNQFTKSNDLSLACVDRNIMPNLTCSIISLSEAEAFRVKVTLSMTGNILLTCQLMSINPNIIMKYIYKYIFMCMRLMCEHSDSTISYRICDHVFIKLKIEGEKGLFVRVPTAIFQNNPLH